MNEDFDLDRLADIPDPLAELSLTPLPPRPGHPDVRPPTRDHVARTRALALFGAIACQAIWLTVFNKRGDLTTVRPTTLLAEVGIPLAAGLVALGAAVAPGERGLGESKEYLAPAALFAPALFAVAAWWERATDVDPESFAWHAARCFIVTSLFALVPAVLAAWSFRRSFASASGWRSAALGMACAGLAAATMGLVCSTGTVLHVLAGHVSVMIVAGVAGALLGRRFGKA
jgi:hypothetical protein